MGNDVFNLQRFVEAQNRVYDSVVTELKNGRKTSHWMWFVFPQIKGLGSTPVSQYYAIGSCQEAKAYFDHPVLRQRLIELCEILMALPVKDPKLIFGSIDARKLRSSMTLFAFLTNEPVFFEIIDKFFCGNICSKTRRFIEGECPEALENYGRRM